MNIFVCPVCRGELEKIEGSYKCANGHSFDISSSGEVFLLRTSKGAHGDSREMVLARKKYLELGYYEPLSRAIENGVRELDFETSVVYFDAGCGTGYYTKRIYEALKECHDTRLFGVDISKDATKICAKAIKEGSFATASLYELPVKSEAVDLVTNIFSPMADSELLRILKKGGYLFYAVPAPKHLFSLKQVLYNTPYENEEKEVEYDGFEHVTRLEVNSVSTLSGDELQNLFSMTPYFWRTSKEGVERLKKKEKLDVEFSFYVHIYRKI